MNCLALSLNIPQAECIFLHIHPHLGQGHWAWHQKTRVESWLGHFAAVRLWVSHPTSPVWSSLSVNCASGTLHHTLVLPCTGKSHTLFTWLLKDRGCFSCVFLATELANSRGQWIFVDNLLIKMMVFMPPCKGWKKRRRGRLPHGYTESFLNSSSWGLKNVHWNHRKFLRLIIYIAK